MNKLIIFVLIAVLAVGCSPIEKDSEDYVSRITVLESALSETSELLSDEKERNIKLEEINNSLSEQIQFQEELKAELIELHEIPMITNGKSNEPSGLMKYIGEVGIRTYPHNDAPVLISPDEFDYDDLTVFCRAVIKVGYKGNNSPKWAIVLINDFGRMKAGYVPYNELEELEYDRYASIESLGGFATGNRIEKVIGVLDRNFVTTTDNVCMYTFYDFEEENSIAIYGEPSLNIFVSNDFHIDAIWTNSSKYELNSGYRVGDKAIEVVSYYRELYPESNVLQVVQSGWLEFQLSEDEYLRIYIDTDELTDEAIVTRIDIL